MKKWTVINQHDGNDTFEAEGDNYGEAACDALQQLGWAISISESDEDEDTPNAELSDPWCIEYQGFLQGTIHREFETEKRVKQWADQCGKARESKIFKKINDQSQL